MVSESFGEFYNTLSGGLIVVLLVVCLDVVRNHLTESGDRYFRIPILDEGFTGKRERALVYVVFTLVSAFGVGIIKTSLVGAIASDPRLLVSCFGALLFLGPFVINDRKNWNINDGGLYGTGLLVIGTLIALGPWLGPPLLDYLLRVATSIINGVTSYIVGGVTSTVNRVIESIVGGITGFIDSLPKEQIGVGVMLLVVLVLLFRQ
ncbi:hypothetical protein M0R89_10290 [Halorussus limi]|uniref:Uncharacterized protein n=1 Tax=Halorussus limi TaxID=2938695 RepID=A0A8U0HQB9_9EURY|nr:hypothetical protein [Halorussus limi]UPV72936.1 hypothetical protein M0R89_10290 [Halorussus limi]